MKKAFKKFISVGVALVFSLLNTGCMNVKNVDYESYVQGVTDTSIKVGNSIAVSGPLAPVGIPFKKGIEAYFLMVNENGGIDGRMIDYVHHDDEFNPEKGRIALEKMVYDEEVFALVGHFGTPIVGATLNDIIDIGVPTVYFATGTGLLYDEKVDGNKKCIFPVQPVYPMEGRIISTRAKSKFKAQKIGVIYTGDDIGKDLLKGILQEGENLGIEIVSEQVNVGDFDISSAVTKIKGEKVDLIAVAAIQNTFPQIIKELAKQGVEIDVMTSYVNNDVTMTESVKDYVGDQFDIYANAWVDLKSEELETFSKWISENNDEDLSGNIYAITGWIAGSFFVEGLKRLEGEEITWENYIKVMEEMPVINPFGGDLNYSNGRRVGVEKMALVKMNAEREIGWEVVERIMSMEEIMAGDYVN